MESKQFSEFTVGESFVTDGRTITEADQINFAGLAGSFHPMHLDEEAMQDSEYGERVVYGLLVLSVASGLRAQTGLFHETAIAYYGIDDLRFVAPVMIGDTVRNEMTVAELEPRDADSGVVVLDEEITNQHGETVLVERTRLLVRDGE
jgi:acyl dehydratase